MIRAVEQENTGTGTGQGVDEISSMDHEPLNGIELSGPSATATTITTATATATAGDDGDHANEDTEACLDSVVMKAPDSLHDHPEEDADDEDDREDSRSIRLIWQALLSGVVLQVLWIGLVWLFSRGRVCAV